MTDKPARLLDCGLCYEEQGEEVHPHPECPIGQPGPAVDRTTVARALVALRAGNHITARLLLESAMNPAGAVQSPADRPASCRCHSREGLTPEQHENDCPLVVPAGRAALRDRIAGALLTTRRTDYADLNVKADHRNHRFDARCALCTYDVDALAVAVLAVLPEPVDRAAETLTGHEKAMLGFALEMAEEEIHARSLEFTDDDWAALTSLRRLAGEQRTPDEAEQHPTTEVQRCDAGFVLGGRCVKPAGHDGPHSVAPGVTEATDQRRSPSV